MYCWDYTVKMQITYKELHSYNNITAKAVNYMPLRSNTHTCRNYSKGQKVINYFHALIYLGKLRLLLVMVTIHKSKRYTIIVGNIGKFGKYCQIKNELIILMDAHLWC